MIWTRSSLDSEDDFKPRPQLFEHPKLFLGQSDRLVYLNANSLGLKLKSIDDKLLNQCQIWGDYAIRGYFDTTPTWLALQESIKPKLAELVGAKLGEAMAMGSLTNNLHLALISFYQPTPQRFKIMRLKGFCSDTYAITSRVQQRLATLEAFLGYAPFSLEDAIIEINLDDNLYIPLETIEKTLSEHGHETSVFVIDAVHYLSGQVLNIKEMTKLAHRFGCKVGFDLAHAIGNIPLKLHDWNVDFAVWCHYKYIAAGPGAIGGLFIHEKYATDPTYLRLTGWWGNKVETRFRMASLFDPILNVEGWALSNPGLFPMVALDESLSIFEDIDFRALLRKNNRLISYLIYLLKKEFNQEVTIITPLDAKERASQLSFRLLNDYPTPDLEKIFLEHGCVCDVRGKIIRVAVTGLYNTYEDVFYFIEKLRLILKEIL